MQVSKSTEMILGEINKMVDHRQHYKVLDQFSYKMFERFQEETRGIVFSKALRIFYDRYCTVPGISVYTLSAYHEVANNILIDAVRMEGTTSGQIQIPSPRPVLVGALNFDIRYPRQPGSFQADGLAASYDDITHPYMIWETNYRRGPVEEARQRIQRIVQNFRGQVRTGILLAHHESERMWSIEVFRYFNTDTFDNHPEQILTANRVVQQVGEPDQFLGVDRDREMENIGTVRRSLRANRCHAVYSQEGGHYIVWPREMAVNWIPLQMGDLFLGFEHEFAAQDGMNASDATFMFYVRCFRPLK